MIKFKKNKGHPKILKTRDYSHKINERKNTHTHNIFLKTPKMIPKFVRRPNGNVLVNEDLLTEGDARVKRSSQGS